MDCPPEEGKGGFGAPGGGIAAGFGDPSTLKESVLSKSKIPGGGAVGFREVGTTLGASTAGAGGFGTEPAGGAIPGGIRGDKAGFGVGLVTGAGAGADFLSKRASNPPSEGAGVGGLSPGVAMGFGAGGAPGAGGVAGFLSISASNKPGPAGFIPAGGLEEGVGGEGGAGTGGFTAAGEMGAEA
jgi:hypothetical protein